MWEGEKTPYKDASNRSTVDHIIPRSIGGIDHPDNWQIMCHDCNVNKGCFYVDKQMMMD
jgi:5-methylcytosine-specific restriction endonuclease McrA